MKILFLARHYTYFRNYESVIAELAGRGHQLHLAAEREEDLGGREMVERLAQKHPAVSFGWVPSREDAWGDFAIKLRMTIDYLRYLDAFYDTAQLRTTSSCHQQEGSILSLFMMALLRNFRCPLSRVVQRCNCALLTKIPWSSTKLPRRIGG